ncbi:acetyl/propionyl/methylcrotonyl-CoA carboxylase subunit alpha [Paraburkholderia sp. RL17-373-BIF-A]|uniref:acetyl/propionyl/methylcrotonyl-CoA carboxylase subunit alpha n=1 Tax=Paraburkholderia sp. RL17-373-BIF-A TaxID=3031629 RepID=UPI0038BA7C26
MFESILIANRGEIACRIARTCRRLGIRVIAVYSDADRHARHVREADTAVRIGPAEAARSYLDADAIIRAALETGASAIHPGYGFLSESTQLVRRCAEHGIAWIGPSADVIEKMGSKIESKRIAEQADVPCVPGYHGDQQTPEALFAVARRIGAPILIKASAGGGGKGMRRVDDLDDFAAQLALAKQEALRAFGDDRVLLEKLILRPRHLEVQLAGDHHGHLVHLFERECSIQRNYQKVIEEAPAPNLPAPVRAALFDAALKLGRAIGYDSLGTVEFVFGDGSDTPYFLEMNTRLQVEHPVTETVTGLDLVEWQIRIAAGENLPVTDQAAISVSGWAIEARVNCEDPAHGHRPEFGTVTQYAEPPVAGVRIDSGIMSGSEVTPHYDSMVAKVIGFGATRPQAAERLRAGLEAFEAGGIGTNQSLLCAIADHPLFRSGRLTTDFLSEAFEEGWKAEPDALEQAIAAAALHASTAREPARDDYWQRQSGHRFMSATGRRAAARLRVSIDGDERSVTIERDGNGWRATSGDAPALHFDARIEARIDGATRVHIEPAHGVRRTFTMSRDGEHVYVNHRGTRWRMAVVSELAALAQVAARAGAQGSEVRSDMPGSVTEIHVKAGDEVKAGDVLVVMEAMKLIFPLAAPRDGVIESLHCQVGEIVPRGQTLVQLTPLEPAEDTAKTPDATESIDK